MEIMEIKKLIESAAHTVTRNLCSVDQVDATESYVFAVLQSLLSLLRVYCEQQLLLLQVLLSPFCCTLRCR